MNGTAKDEITSYVDAVREALADLPDATRQELLEDLPDHLGEVLADGEGTLTDRLGSPQAYAAELRAAASVGGGLPGPPPPDRLAHLRTTAGARLRAADARVGPLLGHARASEFLALLRPAWWVLRGYLVAMVLAHLLDDSGQPIGLLPRIGGSEAVALLLLIAMILASVWLGRRRVPLAPLPRFGLYAGTLVLVLVALTGFLDADSNFRGASYQDAGYDNPYGHIQDVYVYDQQGRPLTRVRLFDQNGQPIELGWQWCAPDESPPDFDGRRPGSEYPHCPHGSPFPVLPPVEPAPAPTRDGVPDPGPPSTPASGAATAPSMDASAAPAPPPLNASRAPTASSPPR